MTGSRCSSTEGSGIRIDDGVATKRSQEFSALVLAQALNAAALCDTDSFHRAPGFHLAHRGKRFEDREHLGLGDEFVARRELQNISKTDLASLELLLQFGSDPAGLGRFGQRSLAGGGCRARDDSGDQ